MSRHVLGKGDSVSIKKMSCTSVFLVVIAGIDYRKIHSNRVSCQRYNSCRSNYFNHDMRMHKNSLKTENRGRRTNYFDFQFSLLAYVNNTSQLPMSSAEVIKVRLSV